MVIFQIAGVETLQCNVSTRINILHFVGAGFKRALPFILPTYHLKLTTLTYNYSHQRVVRPFTLTDLDIIKNGFLSLIEMDQISVRTHNAIYFLYRAWHLTKWMDSFILMMCSLESLFSKDKPGRATKILATRVSSLLNSKEKCNKSDIENLYNLRSDMTHGRISANEEPSENLKQLNHLEFVTTECFRIFVENKLYKKYVDKGTRDIFLSTLNTSDSSTIVKNKIERIDI